MSRVCLLAGAIVVVALTAYVVLPLCGTPRSADAQRDWLKEYDALAKEFSGEFVIEDGDNVPLEGPRRLVYYTPQLSDRNPVFQGAIYALHISGNPEVVIAIEDSRPPDDPDTVNTYIEISRLSGLAINVSRNDEIVAEFPRASSVAGAYVGLMK